MAIKNIQLKFEIEPHRFLKACKDTTGLKWEDFFLMLCNKCYSTDDARVLEVLNSVPPTVTSRDLPGANFEKEEA